MNDTESERYKQKCTKCGNVAVTTNEWDNSGCCVAKAITIEQLDG